MARASVRITGLSDLQSGFRRMDASLQRAVDGAMSDAAEEVVSRARRDVPRRSGAAVRSLMASEGTIIAGGPRVPYYAFVDFGGRVGRKKSVLRRFIRGGRYIYPAYHHLERELLDMFGETIRDLGKASGVEVTRG